MKPAWGGVEGRWRDVGSSTCWPEDPPGARCPSDLTAREGSEGGWWNLETDPTNCEKPLGREKVGPLYGRELQTGVGGGPAQTGDRPREAAFACHSPGVRVGATEPSRASQGHCG